MSEEKILNKYIELINKGYCRDCNELNCIDNFPQKKIANAISNLQQENKILRENAEHNDKVVDKVNWENRLLKGVIEEVRKCVNNSKISYLAMSKLPEDLLQILDKVKENK